MSAPPTPSRRRKRRSSPAQPEAILARRCNPLQRGNPCTCCLDDLIANNAQATRLSISPRGDGGHRFLSKHLVNHTGSIPYGINDCETPTRIGENGLMVSEMAWLHTHMQKHTAECASNEVSENIVRLHNSASSTADNTQRALSLVAEAAHVIREIEERAAAVEAHSQALLSDNMAQLQAAKERIKFLENDRKTAEICIRAFEANYNGSGRFPHESRGGKSVIRRDAGRKVCGGPRKPREHSHRSKRRSVLSSSQNDGSLLLKARGRLRAICECLRG